MFCSSSTKEFKIPSDKIYRGEGNCNVVISLQKEGKILRIRKVARQHSLLGWLINWITDILYWYCRGSVSDDELRDLTFYKKIIRPLLGENYVCDAQQVFLSKKEVKKLERELAHLRPDNRKHKTLQYGRAAIFEDYAFLATKNDSYLLNNDTFAIEIKPKQGWVPFSEKHFPKCIFCMNQYLKRDNGQIKYLSSYCPLDLFSGETTKMIKAIKALMHNPQNNFRIFKNGSICFDERHGTDSLSVICDFFKTDENFDDLTEEFCLLIQKCLLKNFDSVPKLNNCDKKLFCEWNKIIRENSTQSKLPKGSVLERILSVQMLDTEGNQYYYKLLGNKRFHDFDYVNNLINAVIDNADTCLKCKVMMLANTEHKRDQLNDLQFLPYLISAIAKDCSLMLTFRKIVGGLSDKAVEDNVVSTKYGDFIINVGIFDLYPKPMSTILKHRRKIWKLLQIMKEEKVSREN